MINYVTGFCFDDSGKNVVLIRKLKPAWQAGKLNGVGGKKESTDDFWLAAMAREFAEETGVQTDMTLWREIGAIYETEYKCVFFSLFDSIAYESAKTMEKEQIEKYSVDEVLCRTDIIPNLRWIIPFAIHQYFDTPYEPFYLGIE